MKFRLVLAMGLLVFLSAALPGLAVPVPEATARGFLHALKSRNVTQATTFCDMSIQVIEDGSEGLSRAMDADQFCKALAPTTSDGWVYAVNPAKIAYYDAQDKRLWAGTYKFGEKDAWFAIGDTDHSLQWMSTDYVKESFGTTISATGWVLFLHKVQGKWLIYKAVKTGVILK